MTSAVNGLLTKLSIDLASLNQLITERNGDSSLSIHHAQLTVRNLIRDQNFESVKFDPSIEE